MSAEREPLLDLRHEVDERAHAAGELRGGCVHDVHAEVGRGQVVEHGKVPALVDDGITLFDSSAILERANGLKDKVTIKTTFDAEAKKAMFPNMIG